MTYLESPEPVIAGAQIEPTRPSAQPRSLGKVPAFDLIGVLLDKGIAVLGEPFTGGQEQAAMPRAFFEQALHQLQAERDSLANQLWIIVTGVDVLECRNGGASLVNGDILHCTPDVDHRE